jgi:hypothetical protein
VGHSNVDIHRGIVCCADVRIVPNFLPVLLRNKKRERTP